MKTQATTFSRALALLGLLLLLLTMVASGMSLEPGLWQKIPPLTVLLGGFVLLAQCASLVASGTSAIPANLLWRLIAAFGFFALAFNLLILLIPDTMWDLPKPLAGQAAALPAGMPAGVDPRLKDVVDISGPFSPMLMLVINTLLLAVAFLGAKVEDGNPDLEPVA